MPTRALAVRSGCLTSMFIGIPPWSSYTLLETLQSIIGRKRVVHQDLAVQSGRNSSRHALIAIELPVGKVRGIEQYSIGAQMVDRPLHLVRIGRRIERLDGQADVVAHDLRRRAVNPGHLGAHAAPELREPPEEAGQPC